MIIKDIVVLEEWDYENIWRKFKMRLVSDGERIWFEYKNASSPLIGLPWREDVLMETIEDETFNAIVPVFE